MSTKYLNQENIIRKVYDPSTESLKTTAIASFVGGEVEVIISDENDSIRIGDGEGDYLAINDDGSINVNVVETASVTNSYNEITSVASGIPSTILSYIPVNNGRIKHINVSGSNIATFEILVNAVVIDKARTYFGGQLNYFFNMDNGYQVNAGQLVVVRVTHNRPDLGDFNARLQFVEE